MKRFLPLLMSLYLLLSFSACGQKAVTESAPSWQEQYDLGVRYLSEGNYEEAIIAFTAAIEIDPKNADAYLALSEVYVTTENIEKAIELLENAQEIIQSDAIERHLAELKEILDPPKPTEEFDENGNIIRRNYYDEYGNLEFYDLYSVDLETGVSRIDEYNADGSLNGYTLEYSSEDGLTTYSDYFNSNGSFSHRSVRVVDENSIWLYSATLNEAGEEIRRSVPVYDPEGKQLGWDNFFKGALDSYVRHEDGKTVYYDADGNVTRYT